MVQRHLNGESYGAIAADFGLSAGFVGRVVRAAGVTARQRAKARASAALVDWQCSRCGRNEQRTLRRAEAAVCAFGCRPTPQQQPDAAALIDAMQTLAQRIGRTPSQAALYAANDMPSCADYVRVFGSLRAAQGAAGLTPNRRGWGGRLDPQQEDAQ
jgi:hypothetical protein